MVESCVILTAGTGSRAAPVTDALHKSLLPIGGVTGLDTAIRYSTTLGLKPIVVVGHLADQVTEHMRTRHPTVDVVRTDNKTSNLLASLGAARPVLQGEAFAWMGASLFFDECKQLTSLIAEHRERKPFCSLFRQTSTRFKPKLQFKGEALVDFIVGEAETPWSAPTFFVVSRSFLDYARSLGEHNVFKRAIDDGHSFHCRDLAGWTREIHTLADYWDVLTVMCQDGYIDAVSSLEGSSLRRCYVHRSAITDCRLSDCVVIDARLEGVEDYGRLFFRGIKTSLQRGQQ